MSDTRLVICNGEKGNERIIEKVNEEFNIFKYKDNELIGKNINILIKKLIKRLKINNLSLNDNEIPFYAICKFNKFL